MNEYYVLGYIATLMIGVAALVVHITARHKQLPSRSLMQQQRTTTIFLGLLLFFNFSDLYISLCENMVDSTNMTAMIVQWVLVLQNVLEVVMIYAIIEMERCMAQAHKAHWIDISFVVMGMAILFCDILELRGGFDTEASYISFMIILNAIPILFLIGVGFDYWRVLRQSESSQTHWALLLYNVLCVLMSGIATATIADARTSYDFFIDDEIVYIIMWLVFNTANLVYVWKQILVYEVKKIEPVEVQSEEERLAEIFEAYALSERECEIAKHLIAGRNNKEIASIMYLSPNTVKVHASNLYRKLGVTNRVQAVRVLGGEKPNRCEADR